VSDCYSARVFQVSSLSSTTINVASGTFPTATGYNPGALVSVPTTSVFFIAPGTDGDSALWRGDFNVPGPALSSNLGNMVANEIVPDVENMQVLYGVDPGLTGAVTYYQTADQVTNFDAVESVRIGLLIAGPAAAQAKPKAAITTTVLGTSVVEPQDTRQRQVVEFTVSLRDALH
jgi:hypothetical protein